MVHTAKLYIKLENSDIYTIERKYKDKISLISNKLDKKFKGIKTTITKRYNEWFMFLTLDFIVLLGKSEIKEKDYLIVEEKINLFLFEVFGNLRKEVILIRIDYRLDVYIKNKEERDLILYLYKKTHDKYKFKKKYSEYESTIYFNSKSIQVIVYDKMKERNDKIEFIQNYEKDVLRFEVRLQNRHLNYMKHSNKIDKRLKNYFKSELYKKYIYDNFKTLLYRGDYYKMYRCEKIINNSDLQKKDKNELRKFLIFISKYGIEKTKQEYSKYKFNKYKNLLEKLEINPIIIPKNYKIKLTNGYMKNPFANL